MREDTMVYYSIHNYCSPSHVIRIGVFTDRALMPVTYDLFPCTSNYTSTYRPNFPEIKKRFHMKRMITVSNKAVNNGDNIWKSSIHRPRTATSSTYRRTALTGN